MTKIESIIRNTLNLPVSDDLSLYKNVEDKKLYSDKICEIVNNNIPKIDHSFDKKVLNDLKETGYSIVENFLTDDEVLSLKDYVSNFKGYQFHVPNRANNQIPEKYSDELNWNICSYKMNHLFHNPFLIKLMTRPDIVALAQEYLGCLPVVAEMNIFWNKFTGEKFHTQNVHRDYNDFKFLTVFIYLTDVDDDNGPHVYYPKTHNGEEVSEEPVVIKAKAGTAIFGDTYALHYGKPLEKGQRLLFWSRYSIHKSNNFYRDKCEEYLQEPSVFFDVLDDNLINRHLLSSFIKDQEIK